MKKEEPQDYLEGVVSVDKGKFCGNSSILRNELEGATKIENIKHTSPFCQLRDSVQHHRQNSNLIEKSYSMT